MADFTSITTWRNMFTKHGSKMGWGLVLLFGIPLVFTFGLSNYQGRGAENSRDANTNQTVMKVNGEEVSRAEVLSEIGRMQNNGSAKPGQQTAQMHAAAVNNVIQRVVAEQMAAQRGVKPDDAEVDKTLAQVREQMVPKNASDADWRAALLTNTGKTLSEFRDYVAKQMIIPALLHAYENDIKVTDQEAKNQKAQVKFDIVLILAKTDKPSMFSNSKGPKPLPDADAKKKAEELLAQVKSGADIKAIAKANSGDFSAAQGGDSGLRPEFSSNGGMMGMPDGLGYGKDFDEAIHKTAVGQLTDVIKVTGFQPGYAFAKVVDRKTDLPKDFDVRKEVKSLQEQRGMKKFEADLKAQVKTAKVDILDPETKAYYDYFKLQEANQQQQAAMFGQTSEEPAPTKAQVDTLEKSVQTDFEEVVKRNPKDVTASLILADILKKQQFGPQGDAIRDRLQTLYETALVGTEDQEIRLALASIYHSKKLDDKAADQYKMISQLQHAKMPTQPTTKDLPTVQEAQKTYETLMRQFNQIGKPEEANKEKQHADELTPTIARLQVEQQAEQKKQMEEQAATRAAAQAAEKNKGKTKTGATAPPGGVSITPPGGSAATPGGTINLTPPAPGGSGSAPVPVTPGRP